MFKSRPYQLTLTRKPTNQRTGTYRLAPQGLVRKSLNVAEDAEVELEVDEPAEVSEICVAING